MPPLSRSPCIPLQHAVWSRARAATCKFSALNKALAHALYRANFIAWATSSGPRAPDPSIVKSFTPEELLDMNLSFRGNPLKKQLWMGLRYADHDALHPRVPAIGKILGVNKAPRIGPSELERLLGGEKVTLEGREFSELNNGQALFLRTGTAEVMESREALEKGATGELICRVWPFREKRDAKKGEEISAAREREVEDGVDSNSAASEARS
ncbi:hypothetical protein JX266_000874 [Neoarthrinium moseri]|uniref:uncharacterized protein n=1 Tax=Neoarthrinium moseri TaxID=1658444 RepID=UPI001FDD0E9C|nr:uncharacterized protein JN550_000207 [Neoarthrinium moseri]KAI1854756.1 hypothetical protein JX266_000874 [Neoarthrinium moseri]KAI1878025.1 hypothetical protein JN550_000207 [Neoarthrinium moseri]